MKIRERFDRLSPARRKTVIWSVLGIFLEEVAVKWCVNATEYTKSYGGKPWRYVPIPHDSIAPNMTLCGLVQRFGT